MTAIFLSHSSADNAAAAEMKAWLNAQGHTSLFLDFDPEAGIKGGAAWEQTLYRQLRQCQAVIALLTPSWLASKWCLVELALARERGKAIFPVKMQPCDAGGTFSDIQHIDLTAQPEEGYRRLKIGLLERGLDPLDVFDWDPKRPPYPGLMAFQEADAAIFFGRGEEILKTLETLDGLRRQGREAARFGLLLGASGSGKSSLARAGVIPRLKKKPAEWLPIPPFRPQIEPLDELAMAMAAAFTSQGRPRDWSAIRTELHAAASRNPVDGQVLLNLARDLALASQQPETTVLLTIDQAEELFGYSSPEASTRFLRLLRAALEVADRRLMAIATMRSDFLGEFQNHPVLQDSEYAHHFRYQAMLVDPMPLLSFPAIIEGPAQLAGVQLDHGLVEVMVRDTGTRDALPLLAFTLRRLYERYGHDGRLTVVEYEALGRLEGAIREEAQRIITDDNPTPEALEALHAAFVPTMVRINAEGVYARRRARFATMRQQAVPLLRRFVDARLLVTDRDSQGRETIEVAHEALLRTWPQLVGWLAEDRDKLRLLEGLQRSAEEWIQGGRRDDLLIHRNGRLKDAEALLANPRFTIPETSSERVYLVACGVAQQAREAAEKDEQERRIRDAERIAEEQKKAATAQKRTARATLVGFVVALLVAALAGWQWREAGVQKNRSQKAQDETREQLVRLDVKNAARLLNGDGIGSGDRLLSEDDISGALLWLAQGLGDEAGDEKREFLHRVRLKAFLNHLSKPLRIWYHPGTAPFSAFSPDGRIILTTSHEKTARIWDVITGKEVCNWRMSGLPDAAVFSPDGRRVVLVDLNDPSADLRDTSTGQRIAVLRHEGIGIMHAVFSPDGRRLVTSGRDGMARSWDGTTGLSVAPPLEHKFDVESAGFSPDGRYLYTISLTGPTRDQSKSVVTVWDSSSGIKKLSTFPENDEAKVEFTLDAHRMVVLSYRHRLNFNGDPRVRLSEYDLVTTKQVAKFDQFQGRALAFSPDGRIVVTVTDDKTVQLWSTMSGQRIGSPLSHEFNWEVGASFSPDGLQVLTFGGETATRVWDVITGNPLVPAMTHESKVTSATWAPEGSRVLTTSESGLTRLWDLRVDEPNLEFDQGNNSNAVSFSSDGRRALTVSHRTDEVRVWDTMTGRQIGPPIRHEGSDEYLQATLGPDGKRVLTFRANKAGEDRADRIVRLWDADSGSQIAVTGYANPLEPSAFSRDGRRFLTTAADKVDIWNAADGRLIATIGPFHPLHQALLDADGLRLLTVSGAERATQVWDATTGNSVSPTVVRKPPIGWVQFSADARSLLTVRGPSIQIWDSINDRPQTTLDAPPEQTFSDAAFSPDGALVLGEMQNGVRIWASATGQLVTSIHDDRLKRAKFSPDGRRVLTTTGDETAHVSDATTGAELALSIRHETSTLDASFSPDGRYVLTSGLKDTFINGVQVWDASSGHPVTPLLRLPDGFLAEFSPDGRLLTSGRKAIQIWELTPDPRPVDDLKRLARLIAGHEIDNKGALVPLKPDAILESWKIIQPKYVPDAMSSSAAVLRWHRYEADRAKENDYSYAAAWHLDRLTAEEPGRQTPR